MHRYPCVVPPKNNPTGRTVCGSCHKKKIRGSLSPRKRGEEAPKKKVCCVPKPVRSGVEQIPIRRTRGAVQRAEIHDLEARLREYETDMAVLCQRLGYTYFAVVDLIKNLERTDVEGRRKLLGQMLSILA